MGSSTANAAPSCSPCCFRGRNNPYFGGQRAGRPRGRHVSHEESPGSTELTVPGNARRVAIASAKAAQGQCHRKHNARLRTGKGERERQERTAVLATGPARLNQQGAR